MYFQYSDILIDYFARAGNPQLIEVRWVGGINPDTPIDRDGTDETNITDYGTAIYVDCDTWNPTTAEAQVWNLQTCQGKFLHYIGYDCASSKVLTESFFEQTLSLAMQPNSMAIRMISSPRDNLGQRHDSC